MDKMITCDLIGTTKDNWNLFIELAAEISR